MPLVVLLVALCLSLALASPAVAADARTVALAPAADVSFPFSCSWGYDWEERCWRDDSSRIPIGGDTDKVWRGALRFSFDSIPAGSSIVSARLDVFYDRVCIASYDGSIPCDGRPFTLEAHAILSPDWFDEREPEFDPFVLARYALPFGSGSRWMSWDLTQTAEDWAYGIAENHGLLLKVADGEEWSETGPKPPSSGFANAALRPRLVVTYFPPR
jgi:hypothetical protein